DALPISVIEAGVLASSWSYFAAVLERTCSYSVAVLTGVPSSLSSGSFSFGSSAARRLQASRTMMQAVIWRRVLIALLFSVVECAGRGEKIQRCIFPGSSADSGTNEAPMNDLRSAEEKLAALKQRFALSLPGRLDAIETALAGD